MSGPRSQTEPLLSSAGTERARKFQPCPGRECGDLGCPGAPLRSEGPRCCRWLRPSRMRRSRPLAPPRPDPGCPARPRPAAPTPAPRSPSERWSRGSAPRGHRRGSESPSCPRPAPARSLRAAGPARSARGASAPGLWAALTSRPPQLSAPASSRAGAL